MHPKEKVQHDLTEAMKSGDTKRRAVLRLLMAAFKQVEVDKRIELSESEALGILMYEGKKRREAIAEMNQAGRTELAEQEQYELSVIETYLPQQLSREKIEEMVREVIKEVGATSPSDTGQVMKAIMPRLKGQADGKMVNTIVQKMLNQ